MRQFVASFSVDRTGILPPADASTENLIISHSITLLLMPGASGLQPIAAAQPTSVTRLVSVVCREKVSLVNYNSCSYKSKISSWKC